jgi:ribosome maturation factor RimP
MDAKKIENIVNEFLKDGEYFLVDVEVRKGNVVNVWVDGDNGITIDECVRISRLIESNFDRDDEDYELRVSSPGLDRPFKMLRQYKKYIGKEINIKTNSEEKFIGTLKSISEEEVEIEKRLGKKEKMGETLILRLDEIKEAKPVISFK